VDLGALKGSWVVRYTYPKNMLGMSRVATPERLDQTPGLRGCTIEACGFRDAYADLMGRGTAVYGISTQSAAYQQEFVRRFHLPFHLLGDADLRLARALDLPTAAIAGETLLRRLTLIADLQGVVRKVYDAIPDPGGHALEVPRYLDGVRGGQA
jgi:peroxiredoxin